MKRYRQRMIALGGMLAMFTLLAVDLITKAWSEAVNIRQVSYFLGLVRLWFTTNPGIAFGIAGDNPVAMAIITAVVIVMCIGIAIAYFTLFRQNAPVRFCLAVIEAGAIGNLIDRLSLGYVRDFVDVRPVGFGVCNLADFFITFGIVVLLFTILFIGKHAIFPLRKKWREEAKAEETARNAKREAEKARRMQNADGAPADASAEAEKSSVVQQGAGSSLPYAVCAACGAPLKEGAKFCTRCGAALPADPPSQEDARRDGAGDGA